MTNQPATIISQINNLAPDDRKALVTHLPNGLENADDKKQLATSSLDATVGNAKVDVLTDSVNKLSDGDKQAIVTNAQLPLSSDTVRDKIWLLVVRAFIILVVGAFLVLAASLFLCDVLNIRSEQVQIILTVFTTAAAFLTGLLAPSPISAKK